MILSCLVQNEDTNAGKWEAGGRQPQQKVLYCGDSDDIPIETKDIQNQTET